MNFFAFLSMSSCTEAAWMCVLQEYETEGKEVEDTAPKTIEEAAEDPPTPPLPGRRQPQPVA